VSYVKGKLASGLDSDNEWMSIASRSKLHETAATDDAERCSSTFDLGLHDTVWPTFTSRRSDRSLVGVAMVTDFVLGTTFVCHGRSQNGS